MILKRLNVTIKEIINLIIKRITARNKSFVTYFERKQNFKNAEIRKDMVIYTRVTIVTVSTYYYFSITNSFQHQKFPPILYTNLCVCLTPQIHRYFNQ